MARITKHVSKVRELRLTVATLISIKTGKTIFQKDIVSAWKQWEDSKYSASMNFADFVIKLYS